MSNTIYSNTIHTWAGQHLQSREALRLFVGAIADAWKRYWLRRARLATIRLLQSLDDRALKDIGISRGEIPYLALGPD